MKTKNYSIRFEENDFDFIRKREGLNTAQSIVSFLLSEYCKLYRTENKSVFDANKVNYAPITQESYEGVKNQIPSHDEAVMWQEPIKDYAYYERLGKSVKYEDAEELIREIFSPNSLQNWQKPMLQKMINARFFDN